jgi:two-component system, LuxR family, sensor kinase FixL
MRTTVHMMPASFDVIDRMDGQRSGDVKASNPDDWDSSHHVRVENFLSARRSGGMESTLEAVSKRPSDAIAFRPIFALPRAVVGLAYIGSYVLLDWVSFVQPITPFGITPWSPGTGLGFVIVLLFGPRMIPYLFIAPLLADLVNLPTFPPWSVELPAAALIGGGYAAASMILLRPSVRFDPALSSLRDLLLLMLVALVSASFVALAYVGLMVTAGLLSIEELAPATLRYWVGDFIGIMVVTPFALIALTHGRTIPASLESTLQIVAIIAALALIFGFAHEQQFQLFYLLFLPIVWMAVRAGLEGVSAGILITQIGLIVGVELYGKDPHDFIAYQLLMLILAMTGLVAGELVTERRRTEFELRLHRESLAQIARRGNLGELAAAIAHEINQPLTAAGTYTRLVTDALHEGDPDIVVVAGTAEKAAAQVERAAEVVRRLRALVRLDRSARAPCNVEWIIRKTVALCQPALDHSRSVVRWTTAADLPSVMVDMLQIEQTLLNIMRNSMEAIEESDRPNGVINIEAALKDPRVVEIRVADNGPGFPPDFIDSFLPFTSKKKEGLGIGLSLCRSIVEAHGGRLWLNRDAGGAEVRFTLPVAEEIHHD